MSIRDFRAVFIGDPVGNKTDRQCFRIHKFQLISGKKAVSLCEKCVTFSITLFNYCNDIRRL